MTLFNDSSKILFSVINSTAHFIYSLIYLLVLYIHIYFHSFILQTFTDHLLYIMLCNKCGMQKSIKQFCAQVSCKGKYTDKAGENFNSRQDIKCHRMLKGHRQKTKRNKREKHRNTLLGLNAEGAKLFSKYYIFACS